MSAFPEKLRNFIDSETWIYAKTMPQWPHEYIVKDKVDKGLFVELVKHIREFGYKDFFYKKQLIYFEEDNLLYWTMGAPIEQTTIINRCKKEDSYAERVGKSID